MYSLPFSMCLARRLMFYPNITTRLICNNRRHLTQTLILYRGYSKENYGVLVRSNGTKILKTLSRKEHQAGKPFLSKLLGYLSNFIERESKIKLVMDLSPPAAVRGMTMLNRELFKSKVLIPSLVIPFKSVAAMSKHFKKSFLLLPGIRPIADISETETNISGKRLLLNPELYKTVDDLSDPDKAALANEGVDLSSWELFELNLDYRNWNHQQILKAVLPEDSDGISGFSTIGHIVHLNLKEELHGYKHVIGEVLLDKVTTAKTVVNKINIIDNTFRNFQMELIAGEDKMVTVAKEHGISYEMDFSKVYWNSRLATEHQRFVGALDKYDIVYDVFAGIGPFAIPAAKKKCYVYANDLNPESYKWLNQNVKLNKIKPEFIVTNNLDGREFIKDTVKTELTKLYCREEHINCKIHVAMNLPALAIEFLDAFVGLFSDSEWKEFKHFENPIIHCYGFSKSDNPEADIQERVETVLERPLESGSFTIRNVRNVAPNKEMLCISFPMQKVVLLNANKMADDGSQEPALKKAKQEVA